MAEKTKPATDFFKVTDPNGVNVQFVSLLAAGGQANGVVSLTFATARFIPTDKGVVDPDFIVSSRLRMDLACAAQLRNEIDRLLGQAQAQLNQALGTALTSTAAVGVSGKPS